MEEGWARDALFSGCPGVSISAEFIIAEVSRAFKIPPTLITDRTREEPYATARAFAYYFVRRFTGMSYPAMARVFKREHSVVRGGVESVRQRIDENDRFRGVSELLEQEILQAARNADPVRSPPYDGQGDAS